VRGNRVFAASAPASRGLLALYDEAAVFYATDAQELKGSKAIGQ